MRDNIIKNKEMELDIGKFFLIVLKHKKIFSIIVLLALIIGLGCIQFFSKIYRTSIIIQSPVYGLLDSGASDIEPVGNIKDLIINNYFHEELKKKVDLSVKNDKINFTADVLENTNTLKINVFLEKSKKVCGPDILLKLADLITENYEKSIKNKFNKLVLQIAQNEEAILLGKKRIVNLQDQIDKMSIREGKLEEELSLINENTKQIMTARKEFLKNDLFKVKTAERDDSVILTANFIQNNLSYLNLVNYQLSDLPLRKANFDTEIKQIELQIKKLFIEVEGLNINKSAIANIRIIAQPETSIDPVSPDKKRILMLSGLIGILCGLIAVFLKEFLQKKGKNV